MCTCTVRYFILTWPKHSNLSVTIKDIANRANVSRGTVDRVIHKRGNVAPYIQQRIENVITELGYKRNVIASQLARNKSLAIALLLPHPSEDIYWSLPHLGIEQGAEEYAYLGIKTSPFYFNLAQPSSFTHATEQIELSKFDACIVAPVFANEASHFLQQVHELGIPIICINTEIDIQIPYYYIGQASYQSGKLAGKLFDISIANPYNIAMIQIGQTFDQAEHYLQKEKGLRDFLREHSIQGHIQSIQLKDYSNESYLLSDLEQFIREHGPFDGYFIPNSKSFRFVKLLRKQLDAKAVIIGFDLISENMTALQNNEIDFLINQNPKQQGLLAIRSIVNHLIFGQEIESRQYVSLDIVVKENL